jgi:hypothetical protein
MTLFANASAAALAPFTGGPLDPREFCKKMEFWASVVQFQQLGPYRRSVMFPWPILLSQLGLRVQRSQYQTPREESGSTVPGSFHHRRLTSYFTLTSYIESNTQRLIKPYYANDLK